MTDRNVVEAIDGLFDLGQGHLAGSIELSLPLWQKIRALNGAEDESNVPDTQLSCSDVHHRTSE